MKWFPVILLVVAYVDPTAAIGKIGEFDVPPGGVEYIGTQTELYCVIGKHCPRDK